PGLLSCRTPRRRRSARRPRHSRRLGARQSRAPASSDGACSCGPGSFEFPHSCVAPHSLYGLAQQSNERATRGAARGLRSSRCVPKSPLPAVDPTAPVSVILTVRNEQRYLADAVASVLDNGFAPGVDVVIAVGPSDDDTAGVAASLERDPRVTVVDNP